MNLGPTTVTSLKSYRLAQRATAVLAGLLHEPSWLVGVRVGLAASGAPTVVATVTNGSIEVRRCFPASIDGIPVVVRECKASSGSGSR
jgi:hypothetical protein